MMIHGFRFLSFMLSLFLVSLLIRNSASFPFSQPNIRTARHCNDRPLVSFLTPIPIIDTRHKHANAIGRRSIHSRPTLLSSTSRSTKNENEALLKQNTAKESLLKLLDKQRKELKETEDLIESLDLQNLEHVDDMSTNNMNGLGSSLAKSINAGKDYGFTSRSEGCNFETINDLPNDLFQGYGPPANIFSLGKQQFFRNLDAMKGEYKEEEDVKLTATQKKLQKDLKALTLNSTAIWEREAARGEIVAPWVIKAPYYILCYLLDVVFEGRYVFSRFFLLETVARMPYMSYITMLHLYETLGFWRRSADVKRVHFAEEWNEFHHLMVMESLGGDQAWIIRFIAQHSAIVYFIVLAALFTLSPSLSYKFSEMLETHAVDTYGQFIDENEEALKKLPPSFAALEYYTLGISDPMFGEYQTAAHATGGEIRKPGKNMTSLYEVFQAIRADEGDHVGTMKACLDPSIPVLSPALETRVLTGFALVATVGYFMATGDIQDDGFSVELLEGTDDAVVTDTIVDGILAGAAALFGGLKAVEADKETLEGAAEIEELTSILSLPALMAGIRQSVAYFIEALRLL